MTSPVDQLRSIPSFAPPPETSAADKKSSAPATATAAPSVPVSNGEPQNPLVSQLLPGRGISTKSSTGAPQYLFKFSNGTVLDFGSYSNFSKVVNYVAAKLGKAPQDLTLQDVGVVLSGLFSFDVFDESASVFGAASNKTIKKFSTQALAEIPNLLSINKPQNLDDDAVSKAALSYSPTSSSRLLPSSRASRAAYLWQIALELYQGNLKSPGFSAKVSPDKVDPAVLIFCKQFFKQPNVDQGQVSILMALGLIELKEGKYCFTSAGIDASKDFAEFYAPNSKPAESAFVPSLTLATALPPESLALITQYKGKGKAGLPGLKAALLEIYKRTSSVKSAPGEYLEFKSNDPCLKVLKLIFGDSFSYNKTQVNLAIAAGLLKFDPKTGAITVTPAGNDLINPPKTQETSPVPSSPAGDYYKHLGVILGQPTDPNALERDQESKEVKDAKKIFFSDGKFDWKKVDAVIKGPSDKYSDEQKKAAQYMWDNKDKLLTDPLFATLSVGFETKRDNKFSYTEALNVYRGLRTALRPSWNEPAAGDGVPKVNPQTKKPYTKREYAALVLENLKNKFDTHDRKNEAGNLRSGSDSTQGPHFVWFTNDFIDDLKKSGNPDYIELGNQLAWLRDNCPDVWFLLKGDDNRVALSDLNAALGLLAPGNYPAPKAASKPDAAPAA